ncbi:chromosome segregation ATPase [Pseudomonas alcaligenes]|nr:chromosome segregation ATPase [Pseudomonas alcaligenes]
MPALAQAELYRYTNDKGVIVLDRLGVPSQYIDKGYEVLNDQGRVTKTVPPAPTLEERKRMQEEKARAGSDAQLLRLYTSVEDVDRALQRKLAELDGVISVARGNQQSLRTQQANLQAQAADNERAGRQVPEHLVAQISDLRAEQQRLEQDIARYQQDRKNAQAGFAADRARLAQLLQR